MDLAGVNSSMLWTALGEFDVGNEPGTTTSSSTGARRAGKVCGVLTISSYALELRCGVDALRSRKRAELLRAIV